MKQILLILAAVVLVGCGKEAKEKAADDSWMDGAPEIYNPKFKQCVHCAEKDIIISAKTCKHCGKDPDWLDSSEGNTRWGNKIRKEELYERNEKRLESIEKRNEWIKANRPTATGGNNSETESDSSDNNSETESDNSWPLPAGWLWPLVAVGASVAVFSAGEKEGEGEGCVYLIFIVGAVAFLLLFFRFCAPT